MHKSQVFRYLLLSFLGGIALGSLWSVSSEWLLGLVTVATLVLGASAYHRTFGSNEIGVRRRKIGFIIGVCILILASGVWRYNAFNSEQGVMGKFSDILVGGKPLSFTFWGYVDGPIEATKYGGQFAFRVKEIVVPGRSLPADGRILVQASDVPEYRFGDIVAVSGALRRPTNSPDFDYVAYLKKEGIRFVIRDADIRTEGIPLSLSSGERFRVSLYRGIFTVKEKFQEGLRKGIPDPASGYAAGVLLGDRSGLPKTYQDAFRDAGLSHILAISGYNIAIIAEVLLVALVWIVRRRVAFWLSLVAVIFFVILTGASASVVRAAIMGILLTFASGYGRLYDPRNAILLAAGVMAYINPFVLVFDLGFQLSFLAVLGLFYIYPLLQKLTRRVPRLFGVTDIACMTIAAQIAVAPLLIFTFHTISLASIPANILVVPFVPYVMLFAFIAGLLGMVIVPLAQAVGVAAWVLTKYQLGLAVFFASVPGATVSLTMPWYTMVALYVAGAWGIWKLSHRYGT